MPLEPIQTAWGTLFFWRLSQAEHEKPSGYADEPPLRRVFRGLDRLQLDLAGALAIDHIVHGVVLRLDVQRQGLDVRAGPLALTASTMAPESIPCPDTAG
mgnify:CR=1 FL=1